MKVITLCGSMRFFKEMQEIAIELETKHGYIGKSVSEELHYAQMHSKEIIYHET